MDPSIRLPFSFDGIMLEGIAGDTIASALVANGVNRLRGPVGTGGPGAAALVTVGEGATAVRKVDAAAAELVAGMVVRSQNAWSTLWRGFGGVDGVLHALRPARSAGTSPGAVENQGVDFDVNVDVAVVGGGLAGLTAALAASEKGARVLLAEATARLGGWLLSVPETRIHGAPAADFVAGAAATLARQGVTVLTGTTAIGYAADDSLALVQRVGRGHRELAWRVRTREVVRATGPIERLLAFRGNHRPGVMLASTAVTYARRYGAPPGHRAVVLMVDDAGHEAAVALAEAGVEVVAVLDARIGEAVMRTEGRRALAAVRLRGGREERIACDLLVVAGGFEPAAGSFGPRRVPAAANVLETRSAAASPPRAVGGAAGVFGMAEALEDGARGGAEAARVAGAGREAGPTAPHGPSRAVAASAAAGTAPMASTAPETEPAEVVSGDPFVSGRTTPMHDWHRANGAILERVGEWLLPSAYPREDESRAAAIACETLAMRRSAGVVDLSPLGKIDIRGPDTRAVLAGVVGPTVTILEAGRSHPVVIARDDGSPLDEGTLTALADDHLHLATTNGAAAVLARVEDHVRTGGSLRSVFLTSVTEAWGTVAVCGPAAGAVVARVVGAMPQVPPSCFAAARVDGVPIRLFRHAAAGVDRWDIDSPAPVAQSVWERVVAAGATPCGMAAVRLVLGAGATAVSGRDRAAAGTGSTSPSPVTGVAEPMRTLARLPLVRRIPAANLVLSGTGWHLRTVDLAPLALRVGVREAQAVQQALGVPLPEHGAAAVAEPRHGPARFSEITILGRGPDEWLVLAAPSRAVAIVGELEAVLAAEHRQVVDLSGALVVFAFEGDAEPFLASQFALDPALLAAGHVRATMLADVPATLHRRSAERLDLIVRGSSARSVADHLARLLRPLGLISRNDPAAAAG